jgi:nitrate/TMAO reductase-like tetraheme cytochrome c subunit
MRKKFALASLFISSLFAIWGIPTKAGNDHSRHTIASFAKYVEIPGAKAIGVENCANCHDVEAKNFTHAFHAQQDVECEDCHGAGSLHTTPRPSATNA